MNDLDLFSTVNRIKSQLRRLAKTISMILFFYFNYVLSLIIYKVNHLIRQNIKKNKVYRRIVEALALNRTDSKVVQRSWSSLMI